MTRLKLILKKYWNLLLGTTTIDEKIVAKVKTAKAKLSEVKEEFADVAEELQDVVSALKGKVTKSKLRSMTKPQMLKMAKKDHKIELDSKLNKTNLINKVYELYNK
tara:strand:+ start:427 stop:744 length:318 start_codon:yes stop_codon:yes gene_type:complete